VFIKSNKNHLFTSIQPLDIGIINNFKGGYRIKLVNFILEKIEEKIFDSSKTDDTVNKIRGNINILLQAV